MSNESKPGVPSTVSPSSETASANRRNFMKSVVTGAVAAGVVAAAGKAEAATLNATCVTPQLPKTPSSIKLVFNKAKPPTLDDIHRLIDQTFAPSGCPYCGLGGVIDRDTIINNVSLEVAHLGADAPSLVLVQDAKVGF
jgi:hypothetical protein